MAVAKSHQQSYRAQLVIIKEVAAMSHHQPAVLVQQIAIDNHPRTSIPNHDAPTTLHYYAMAVCCTLSDGDALISFVATAAAKCHQHL